MFAALGRFVTRFPWYVLGAWAVAAVLIIAFAPGLKSTTEQADFLPKHYESIKATDILADAFPQQRDNGATIVFDRTDGKPLTADDKQDIDRVKAELKLGSAFTEAAAPQYPPVAQPTVGIVNIGLADGVTGQNESDLDQVETMREDLKDLIRGTDLRAQTTGNLAQGYDQTQSGANAEAIVMMATIILIIVLLGFIFRSVLAAITPILVVVVVYIISRGLIAMAAEAFDLQVDTSLSIILGVVLFGIGTDYFLFYLFRFRERRREGSEHRDSASYAVARAGEAIASAGGAVIVAFMTLTLSSLGMFKSMGPALAIAVTVMLLAALTLVPAVVTLLGRGLFWPSKKWHLPSSGTRFGSIGSSVGRHPVRYVLASGSALVFLTLFIFVGTGYNPTFDLSDSNSSSSTESAKGTDTLEKGGFSAGATQPTPVVLKSNQKLDSGELDTFRTRLESVHGVAEVAKQAVPSADGKTALVMVTLKDDPSTDAALRVIKDDLRPTVQDAAPDGADAYVGGLASVFVDFQAAMNRDYSVVFPIAALIIMVILGLVLRSLVAPWYLMLSVGLGFGATLGAAVIVFQHLKGDDGIVFMLPLLIYLFVVALGTDYNILMISRLREEARSGKEPRAAAAEAVRHSGPTIAVAGVILAGTFAALMLGGNSFLVMMGFSVAFGIMISAFVMAMFFTPALTALIGHAAWWPGHGDETEEEHEARVGHH
ncbi:MMPL family transporter [Nocardioides marmoriginsengisoli]|uniref:MMPL family transporter n=1 Tax=Nocardioides marmoriginsengisoli TaxID=661483 RepID=A0A3N0CCR4_9ACTN|nr:MMPL family transporter [Nocardioides marmoriginsengisoli]RNL61208.1 MMPL family transporter [Nocardioides marmoriginsengisoli]